MNTIRIKIAEHVVEINMEYRPADSLYAAFRTREPADFCVYLTKNDIEMVPSQKNKALIQTSRILKKIALGLLDYNVVLMHGAAIAVQEKAFLFTAPSRTGKTTHILKWLKNCNDAIVVNGDKPFIEFDNEGAYPKVCGTPWAGKEKLYTNTVVPLESIIIMERSEKNYIEPITFIEAFPFIFQQTYHPSDKEKMKKTLYLIQQLSLAVSFWRFQCNNFKEDCFDVAYNALVGKLT